MSSITIQVGGGGGSRYSQGWRAGDQDRKPVTRAARAAAQAKGFKSIRDDCLARGVLWEDPDFPAETKSLCYSEAPPRNCVWKRPKELSSDPRMMVGGASRFDVMQGDLGNCWFLAAVASLCAAANRKGGNKSLLTRVVCVDNSFVENYAGIFHFKIWQYGQWVDVLVDDRLPTQDGRLIYMHSAEANEFWSALIEKVYAKLNGSYEALRGGSASEAMEDFTGGMCEVFNLTKEVPKDFGKILLKADQRNSLMACQIDATPGSMEAIQPNGLVIGHAYSITGIRQINLGGRHTTLIRLRNPWGNDTEWKGAWSDGSPEWQQVGEAQREQLGITFDDDGEFWMSIDDFSRNYHRVEVCNLDPSQLDEGQKGGKKWETSVHEGSWKKRVNAGGCRNFLDTYWTNPQYRVEVQDGDEGDDENLGTLIVGLMQKERRKKRKEGMDCLTIGFSIYKKDQCWYDPYYDPLDDDLYLTIGVDVYKLPSADCGPLDQNFFKYNAAAGRSTYSNMREICGRFRLAPGHYAIIPSTFKPNEEADFIVRTYSERPNNASELDETTGMDEDEFEPKYKYASNIEISSGGGSEGGSFFRLEQQGGHAHPHSWVQQWRMESWNTSDDLDRLTKKLEEDLKKATIGGGQASQQKEQIRRRIRSRQVTDEDVVEEKQVRDLFKQVSGEDLEVDAYELRSILNQTFMKEFKFDGFALETCRSMVAMRDADKSGKLGYDEFKKLWTGLRRWKKIFKEFDQDNSGTFCSFELRQALNSAGFRVSNSTFNAMVMRYSDQEGRIYFNCFVLCAIRLRTMFDTFREKAQAGKAEFVMDEFIQTTMYS